MGGRSWLFVPLLLAGCPHSGSATLDDLSAPDLKIAMDASAPEVPDLSQAPDLSVPDLSPTSDLSTPADLTPAPDLGGPGIDVSHWTIRHYLADADGVAFGGGMFVRVGPTSTIETSADSTAWVARTP